MTRKGLKSLTTALDKKAKELAKLRDSLDDIISEAEEHKEHIEEALEHLDNARDAISRLV